MHAQPNVDGHTVYPDWEEIVTFGDQGPSPQPLIETDRLKAVVVGLKAGQTVPHHPSTEAIYHFLSGTGTMSIGEETVAVHAGATVVVPNGAYRGINASTDTVFLGTRPAEAGHGEPSHDR